MADSSKFTQAIKADPDLGRKFLDEINKLRSDESLEALDGITQAAKNLGFEIDSDFAKKVLDGLQKYEEDGDEPKELSLDDLDSVAGGYYACTLCNFPPLNYIDL